MSHFFSFNSELYDIHHMQLNWEVDQRAEVRHMQCGEEEREESDERESNGIERQEMKRQGETGRGSDRIGWNVMEQCKRE